MLTLIIGFWLHEKYPYCNIIISVAWDQQTHLKIKMALLAVLVSNEKHHNIKYKLLIDYHFGKYNWNVIELEIWSQLSVRTFNDDKVK